MQIFDIPINDDLKEVTQHGSFAFPIAIYEDQLDLNVTGYVNLHWHEELQICYVVRGCVEFQVNQETYVVHEKEGIFVNSNKLHMSKAVEPPDSTYICCNFHPRLIRAFEGSVLDVSYIQPFLDSSELISFMITRDTVWGNTVCDSLVELYNMYVDRPFGYEIMVCGKLMLIWHQFVLAHGDKLNSMKEVEPIDYQRLKLALSFIHQNYMHKISLQDIAQSIHISKGECCRLFKKVMNSTPFEYLLLYRIKKSIVLLETSTLAIGEIASQVGFNSFSYFVERFKSTVGCVPKEYRKQYAEKGGAAPGRHMTAKE